MKLKILISKLRRKFIDPLYLRIQIGRYLEKDIERIFEGKRVAIVGPADSVFNEKRGDFIDGFDLIVRINKGHQLVEKVENQEFIGSRTDVLVTRLDHRESLEPESFDHDILKKHQLKYLIGFIKTPQFGYYYRTLTFIKKFSHLFHNYLKIIPLERYVSIQQSLGGHKPTSGYITLHTIFNSNCSEIYITGFTFFRTDYVSGYREGITSEFQKKKFRKRPDGHNPDKEWRNFLQLYKLYKDRVVLDSFLANEINL